MIFDKLWCNTMESKLTGVVLNMILIGLVFVIGLILYWSFRPYDIVEYQTKTFEMVKDEYRVGEPLTYRLAFCKTGNYSATQIRTLHDGVIYIFPPIESKTREGCHDFVSTSTPTPNVPSGTYTFQTEVVYKPNPIREISYIMESNPFRIVNDD